MNIRHIIVRNELYPEEERLETGISQQVAVYVDYSYPNMDVYEIVKNGKLIEEGPLIKNNVPQRSGFIRIIFYGVTDEVALELANRWVLEEEQKKLDYKVHGVDKNYSVFD
jgi:hypothetical protein